MSQFDNLTDILSNANGVQNGTNLVDGIVPDFTTQSHNGIVSVDSTEIPENVNGGKFDPLLK